MFSAVTCLKIENPCVPNRKMHLHHFHGQFSSFQHLYELISQKKSRALCLDEILLVQTSSNFDVSFHPIQPHPFLRTELFR